MNQDFNLIAFGTDSYKMSHWNLYPEGTEFVYSYCEPRVGGRFNEICFFGLQYVLIRYLTGQVVTQEKIEEAAGICKLHFGSDKVFNREGWEHILNKHGGMLPIKIKALPEGTVVPVSTALFTIENTDPAVPWLTNYLETILSHVWSPITVASSSREIRRIIAKYLDWNGTPEGLNFKLHDFGYRGVSSVETAALAGAAHLATGAMGTDTMAALALLRDYYSEPMAGFSIPATEHSIMTAGGPSGEADIVRRILATHPTGLVAMVIDSYDTIGFIKNVIGNNLDIVNAIKNRNGTVIFRPDCYDNQTEILTEDGWVLFSELENETRVAQYHDNGQVSFIKPTKYIEQDYAGDMIHFYNDYRLDLVVTPNHRMVTVDVKNQSCYIQEANNAKFYFGKDIPRTCVLRDGNESLTPYERFLIAFQADGSYTSSHDKTINPGKYCGYISTRFNFQKPRKQERLIKICENAGLEYSIHREPKRGEELDQNTIYVRIPIKYKLSKFFQDWVNPSSRNRGWCHEFIEELSYWDATRRTLNRIKYDTTIANNADIVQQVAMFAGYGCTYGIHEDNRKEYFNDIHSLNISNRTTIGGQSIKQETINYNGKIYCVQVPTGMIVVRRNKKAVICGNSGEIPEIDVEVFNALEMVFGSKTNAKGFRVLPDQVRIIQGDGIKWLKFEPIDGGGWWHTVEQILNTFHQQRISSDNIAFGSGGGLLQAFDRDTQRFAIKCSAMCVNGEWRDVYKQPLTDATKNSKRGRLAVFHGVKNRFVTGTQEQLYDMQCSDNGIHNPGSVFQDILQIVFEDGELKRRQSLSNIRERAKL